MFSKVMDEERKGVKAWFRRTICETHRQLYDIVVIELAETRPDVIRKLAPLIEEAYLMGVSMNKKLVEAKLVRMSDHDFQTPKEANRNIANRKERKRLVALLEENNQTLTEFGDPNP